MSDPISRLNTALEGRYRIEREIGQGGMATVYLADDLKHDRKVALKVLKPELAAVVGADRFLAEIRTTANLQHPHILPLHDSGEADTFLFFVMPYVEGGTLGDRLKREQQLSVEDALDIARKVGSALDYAHDHGVVHRDIKPGNILLSERGEPMVSDFGIALAVAEAGGGRITETGLSLGTPHYMSPEQATGDQDVSPRSDIYALGCVLYEMLTGEPPFHGGTAQAVLGRILTGDVTPITRLRKAVPINVDHAIRHALERLPADRFETAGAFIKALGNPAFRYGEAAGAEVATASAARWRTIAIGALAVAAGLGGAFLWSNLRSTDEPAGVVRFAIPLPDSILIHTPGNGHDLAISPDGRMIAYQSGENAQSYQIQIRSLDQVEIVPLRGTGEAYGPVFSPSGEELAFGVAPDGLILRKVSAFGGPPTTLTETSGAVWGTSWGDDGWIVYGTSTGGLFRVPEGGGDSEELTTPDPEQDEARHAWPSILPGGEAVVFAISMNGGSPLSTGQLAVLELATLEVTRLGVAGTSPRYLASGQLAYAVEDGTVRAVPFDLGALEVTGSPVPLLEDVVVKSSGGANYDVSRAGRLVYATGQSVGAERVLLWVDRDGREEAISAPPQTYLYPRISPEGRRVALDVRGDQNDIWIWDFAAETPTRLVLGESGGEYPTWTPDGERIAYDNGSRGIWWKAANNTGSAEVLVDSVASERSQIPSPYFFTPDGSALVFRDQQNPDTDDDLIMLSLGPDGEELWSLRGDFIERNAELSPDGSWMAYESTEAGAYEIYVRPFPEVDANQVRVSNNTGHYPLWSRDGTELFYMEEPSRLMAISFEADPVTGRFVVTGRAPVMDWPYYVGAEGRTYDVSPDGERFLAIGTAGDAGEVEGPPPGLTVIDNWFEDVLRRMGGR